MFVQDEMKLTLAPLAHVEAPALAPLFVLMDEEPAAAPAAEAPAPAAKAAAATAAAGRKAREARDQA